MDTVKVLKDFAEELYFRAAAAKDRDERMAIKGVQHSLERAIQRQDQNAIFARPMGECPVAGCSFRAGDSYAGQHPCQAGLAGDPVTHREYLRGCLLRA